MVAECALQSERQVSILYKAHELWAPVSALSTVSFPWQDVFLRENLTTHLHDSSNAKQLSCPPLVLSLSLSLALSVFRSKRRWPQTPEQTECIQGRSVRRDKWWFIMEMCCKCPCAATVFLWEASVEGRGPDRLMSSRREVWQGIKITINFTTCVPLKQAEKRTEWIRMRWDEEGSEDKEKVMP